MIVDQDVTDFLVKEAVHGLGLKSWENEPVKSNCLKASLAVKHEILRLGKYDDIP